MTVRIITAVIVSVVLFAGMFSIQWYISGNLETWRSQGLALSGLQIIMVNAASIISAYWFLLIPLILMISILAAVLWPKRSRE